MTEKTDQERIVELERRVVLMARGYLILLVVSALSGYLAFGAFHKVSASTQAGAVQRVTTISQRCDLTQKITAVLTKDDPLRLPAFQVSYEECIVGLRKAERLAGVTAKPHR
jgi:hypothetical protein